MNRLTSGTSISPQAQAEAEAAFRQRFPEYKRPGGSGLQAVNAARAQLATAARVAQAYRLKSPTPAQRETLQALIGQLVDQEIARRDAQAIEKQRAASAAEQQRQAAARKKQEAPATPVDMEAHARAFRQVCAETLGDPAENMRAVLQRMHRQTAKSDDPAERMRALLERMRLKAL